MPANEIGLGLGNDDDAKDAAAAPSGWSDPLGLYGGDAPKIGGAVSYQPAKVAKQQSSGRSAGAGGILDQMDERDRNDLINTVIAEAAAEGDEGMAGVAAVIRNRAGKRGLSPADIVRQPKQFTGYEAPGREVAKSFNDPEMRARAERIINGVFAGEIEDKTGGADHYHADSVSPDWAGKLQPTTRVGKHLFYTSEKGQTGKRSMPSFDELSASRAKAEEPFNAILRDQDATKAKGRGIADLLPDDEFSQDQDAKDGTSTLLSKLQPGKPASYITNMQPRFRQSLTALFNAAPDYVKEGLDLLSGARSPERQAQIIAENAKKYGFNRKEWETDVAELGPVEAGKKWRPTFRDLGLTKNIGMPGESKHQTGDAGDLGWKGGAFRNAPKEAREWVHENAPNFDLTFPMGHEPWHIEHKDARSGNSTTAQPATKETPAINADANFQASDPMGLYAGGSNPFSAAANKAAQTRAAQADAETAEAKRIAADAETAKANQQAEELAATDPERYALVDESEAAKFTEQWKAANQSSGRLGDFAIGIGIGAGQASRSLDNMGRLLISKLPGGDAITSGLDKIDRWLGNGKSSDERMAELNEKQTARLTDRTQEALKKPVLNDDGSLGDALKDPDWYLAQIAQSTAPMAATMAPSGLIARAAYATALARGATTTAAAATAASAATIAGGVGEGLLGGADAALSVKEQIAKIPRDQLLQSDAVKSLISEGMTEDAAIAAVSEDAQTQAMIVAGALTGLFGGMGDRAIAKIVGEGVSGGIARRTAAGAAKGMVGEGIFEELPQSVGQQVAENAAMQKVDPNRKLTEGVAEAAISGAAVGGVMGGGLGGVGGAMSRKDAHEQAPQADTAESEVQDKGWYKVDPAKDGIERAQQSAPAAAQQTQPEAQQEAKGPISRAIRHAEQAAMERGAGPVKMGRPDIGETVTVNAEGLPPFMGVVDSYDGDEAVVIDHGSGEYLQVPIASLARSAATAPKPESVLPEVSNDPALEPMAPIAGERTSEIAPAKQDVEATARFPGAPEPGRRVMVDDPTLGRFPARVDSYEGEGGAEVLVTNDQGESYQVPLDSVKVNKLTPKEVEAEDLKRNPPIEREIGDAGPLSRKIGKGTVVLPDQKHADLYDFARERVISMKLSGRSKLEVNEAMLPQQKALAKEFGVTVEALGAMADDYRFRVERAGKEARSTLPIQMHTVNERRLKQWQAEAKKAEGTAEAETDNAHWWDVSLDQTGRKEILSAAGIKRSEKSMWGHLTPAIQKKLAMFRVDGPAPQVEQPAERTFRTAKGSTYVIHEDGTTTRDKAERSDPGHEGDKGIKPRTDKTVYLATNSSVLSAAGLNGLGPKGARVAIKDGRGSLLTWNEKEGRWGVLEGSRNIPISDTPTVGSYPLELWNRADDVPGYEAYSRMHAGNAITELTDKPAAKADTSTGNPDTESQSADTSTGPTIDDAANEAATSPTNDRPEPTQAQKEAGNYKVGRVSLGGLELSIENPAGSERKGVDQGGKPWSVKMESHYGYIRGTVGKDKDHIDVFVKPGTAKLNDDSPVFVVDQQTAKGAFDEHKVMMGFDSEEEARKAYLANYTKGWRGLRSITGTTLGEFKTWAKEGDTTKPFGAEPVKWFGTKQKAQAHINKNRLGSTHEIRENGDRFEIHRKPEKSAAENAPATSAPLANATAPEHVQTGVDDRELAQIVDEFKSAQAEMMEGDHPVSNVFQPPKKSEIVRLADKVKVYQQQHGWMTPAEAKAKIAEWKAHAKAQGNDPAIRGANSDKVVLSLFDLSGEWSKPWEEAGYQVYRFDIQADPELGDVNNFSVEFFNDWFGDFEGQDIYAILAACPCTDFAVSGARHFAAKDADGRTVASVKLVHQTLRTIEYFKPAVWAVENPVGRIEDLGGLPPWRLSFDPNHIGDPYTKKTLLWGRFNGDLPIAPVEPTEGSKMHRMYGGKSQATKNARSVTPEGFSYGFFMANNAHDHAAMAVANKFDRLDRDLITKAIDAGVAPDVIETAVEDFYYSELDDDAANAAVRDLLPKPPAPKAKEPAPADAKQESAKKPVNQETAAQPTDTTALFANNKLFTADAVEKARARMRAKFGQLNSGIDPELLIDGMTIAGAYIEAGVRNFTDYARRMTDDFGDAVKPYLLSFWEGARSYPGVDTSGMTSPEESSRLHSEMNRALPASEADSLGAELKKPRQRTPRKGKPEDRTLIGDYGVDHIDAYSDEGERAKEAFLKDGTNYLKAVAATLTERGYAPQNDRKGKAMKPVSANPGGIAVGGEVGLHMRHAETGANVWAMITPSALRGTVPTTPSGISIVLRASARSNDTYATDGTNHWAPVDMTAGQLAEVIDKAARGALAQADYKRSKAAQQDQQKDASTNEPSELGQSGEGTLEGVPADAVQGTEGGRQAGGSPSGSSRANVPDGGSTGTERVSAGRSVPDGEGGLSVPARGRKDAEQRNLPLASDGERGKSRPQDDAEPVEQGAFGPILRGYEGKWKEAALELERRQTGDAIGALHHPDVGPIDLVWGSAGKNDHTGAGLSKLIAWHPEVLADLQGFINRLHVDEARKTPRRIQLIDETGRAGVRLDFDGSAKTWLLTAYEADKRRSSPSRLSLNDIWSGKDAGSDASSDTATKKPSDANASRRTGTEQKIIDPLEKVQSAAVPAQKRPTDHVIAADDGIGEGGAKTKFKNNVAAIQILRTLDTEKRPATRQEQAALAKWVGWGGLRAAFYREDGSVAKGWEREARDLKALLTPEEYAAAESSTRNAHYTSPEIVSGIWSAVQRMGFKGGQVLEPSVGAGNFLGLMPGELRNQARVTGVELDHITGSIAKNLYPSANIQAPMGFEKLSVPDGYFDLAIGNPPFGSERLYDKERRNLNKFSIHNFFFAKSIDALRPGGVLAMVVTNRFLDGNNEAARAYIAKKADLVGAIRLPNNAFLKNAGTEVTTDIVIFRKREDGEAPGSTAWTEIADYRGKDGKTVPLNRYFIDNPDMMLGEFGAYGTMYGPDEPALIARDGEDIAKALAAATEKLPKDIITRPGAPVALEPVVVAEGVNDVHVGSMFASPDGTVHIRTADRIGEAQSQPVEFANDVARERVSGMIRVRDAFARLRRAQIDERATDTQIENLRKRLNTVYDAFVAKHGPINHDVNKRLFRDDPTWPQIAALEQDYDKGVTENLSKKTGEAVRPPSAQKAAVFTKRTQQPYRAPTSASSAKDALALSLNQTGAIDLDLMSRLYGKGKDAILNELGSLVYKTPAGAYETADQYLSGNVKAKLAQAEEAAINDPDFRRNVAALRDVIPADIEAVDIDVKPGAPWIPAKHIVSFIDHITESSGSTAYYSPANAKWALDIQRPSAPSQTLWATDRASVSTILSAALNGQSITIYDKTSNGDVVNQAASEAANEKVERVKTEWSRWIWSDDARRDELAKLYNDTFNTDVLRVYDGSHMTFPGKVGDEIIEMRPSQKAFTWRTLQTGTALADHTVGAGKTIAAIASAMEKRRIGQAKKPMFVVPNHIVGQWAADFIKLYPGAKVLATTENDFEKDNRKRLFARISTGDWDAVIVAHSSFGRIGINPEYEAKFIQEQLAELEESIAELRRNTGQKSRNVNQLTKWRDNMKAKLKRLLDAGEKDDGLTFDELGVDALYVDEAHEFKNLAFATSMTRVAGLGDPKGSKKAADLYMKSRFILERTGGKNLVFLTGTPISNTMAEMYTVQRYLDHDSLKAMGISHFDAWARVFGEVVTDWELSPSGKYKLNSRFARFVNIPELMQRYLSFADVITNDDIKRQLAAIGKKFPLPKVKGGKPAVVVVDRSPDQAQYIGIPTILENGEEVYPEGSLVHRAENLPKKQEKGADNMLKVMSDARKAALDMRLIDPSYGDYHASKIHHAADDMVRIYKQWNDDKGTQLVFIDLSTPKKAKAKEQKRIQELMQKAENGDEDAQSELDKMSPDEFLALESPFSVYDDLKNKLIERGIPEKEIAFIHDANTNLQKEELFGKVRAGKIRFLFGSTAKMGAGTNVQNRLVALHHMDAPWRPSDLEQRDGRGIRQGNELYNADPEGFEIEIRRYATKNTLDARQWQTIEGKAKFIQQLRKGNLKDRSIEDISGEAANAAEMKAAASGNPLILEEMEAKRKLKTLQNRAMEHDREQHRIKDRIREMREEMAQIEDREADITRDAESAGALDGKPFVAEFDGTAYEKHKEFGAALLAAMRKAALTKSDVAEAGRYGDFTIAIHHQYDRAFSVAVEGARTHEVFVQDAAEADPTGLAQRITNTVKKLRDLPKMDAERKAEIARQLPGMESQIGEWGQAQELADTAALHRSLLDRLKPKPKTQSQVAARPDEVATDSADIDPPIADKMPDAPSSPSKDGLRSMEPPKRPADKPIRDYAIDHIRTIGRQTGHEYLMAIDDDGSIVEYGTSGIKNNTGINEKLTAALNNPTRKMVIYHNHPSNGHLSTTDISFLAYPGLHSVWSIGHGGNDTRASLTPEAREQITAKGDTRASVRTLADAATIAHNFVRKHFQQQVDEGTLDADTATRFYLLFALQILERANIIDIQTTLTYDTGRIEGLDALIDDKASSLAKVFFNGRTDQKRRNDRRALALRHVAEVARVPGPAFPLSARRPDKTGLAEAGSSGHSGKGKGREGSASNQNRVAAAPPAASSRVGVTQERVIEEVKGKLTDLQPALLKAIPLNYFTELAQPNMTAVEDYMRVKRQMDAYRGDKHAEADAVAQEWLKYTRLGFMGKDLAKAEQLANLMHDATLAGVDPSDPTFDMLASPSYDDIRARYEALPPKGKALFQSVRDAYLAQALEVDEILLDNVRKAQQIAMDRAERRYKKTLEQIREAGLTGLDRKNAEEDAASTYKAESTKAKYAGKARLTKLRIAFESSRVQAPYFPLARFGRYFVTVRDIDGKVLSFSKFEKAADRDRTARELGRQFPAAKIEAGVMENGGDMRRAMDPRMVAEIEEILGGAGVSGDVMDQIWQRYLESMPDLSARKRQIHRKGRAGYSSDALRAFSSHMFHASHQMARMKYGLELQELVNTTMDQAKEADDQTAGVTLANELVNRHNWVMNPTGSSAAQTMTSAAFVWYLASSPAAAMVNLTQTVMMGAPILGARFGGITKAVAALGKASRDSITGKGSVSNANLTADERHAMNAFYQSGLIDRTQSHDLAGVGETGVKYSPLRAKVMGIISWAFHRAEVWNREVTALAAYRLARDNGAKWNDAVDLAHDLTWKTHFDYSNSSRPAILQNDFAKVALVFRQHNINMLYRVGRDIHQSLKGATPQARKEARYQLAGIVGMMSLMAGVTGTIGFNLLMGVLGMAFGDDDDPLEFDERFKANVVDILGPELGGIVLNGVPGHYLGVDLTSRIGMPDLWFRSPAQELQGKEEFRYWLFQSLGAGVSMAEAIVSGFSIMKDEGNIARGLEMMAPKAVRDLMKAYRYSDEGLTSVRGDQIMRRDEMGVHEIVAQAMGFSPAAVAERWDRNSALKNAERTIRDKRQRLINRWAMATMSGDKDDAAEAVEGMKAFNRVPIHAGVQITKETLERSIKTRARNDAKREDGVLIQNKDLNRALRDQLSKPIYQ